MQFIHSKLIILFFLLNGIVGYAQDVRDMSAQVEVIGVESGLPQSTVRAITQDNAGFMYFATDDGISRFDGFNHHRLDVRSPSQRKLFSFTDMCVDHENQLWATAIEGGLLRYFPDQDLTLEYEFAELFEQYQGGSGIACAIDSQGFLWVATESSLYRVKALDSVNMDVRTFEINRKVPLVDSENFDRSVSTVINHFILIPDGRILLATSQGIKILNQNAFENIEIEPLQNAPIDFLYWDSSDSLMLISNNQLFRIRWVGGQWKASFDVDIGQINQALVGQTMLSVYQDNQQRIWIATKSNGVYVKEVANEYLVHLHRDSSTAQISDNYVVDIYQSKDNLIWLGTWIGGVSKINLPHRGFSLVSNFYTQDDVITNPSIRAIFRTRQGDFWLGMDGQGAFRAKAPDAIYTRFSVDDKSQSGMPSNFIRVFYENSQGALLIGTEEGAGIFNDKNQFLPLDNSPTSHLRVGKAVRALVEDSERTLWMGTYDMGLSWWDKSEMQFKRVALNTNALVDRVTTIYVDTFGMLWVATDASGIYRVNPKSKQVEEHYDKSKERRLATPGNSIWHVYQESQNIFWVGSYGNGLAQFNLNNKTFNYFDTKSGLPNDVIYSIYKDPFGWYWVSTNRGLSRFAPEKNQYYVYGRSHGLLHDEFNAGAFYHDSENRLYYGSLKGLVIVAPDKFTDGEFNQKLLLTDTMFNGKSLRRDDPRYLKTGSDYRPNKIIAYDEYQNITFVFAQTHYAHPELGQFRYRLVGYDADWNTVDGKVRSARYTRLNHGNYRLEVNGKNYEGLWSNSPLSIDIELVAPWYLSAVAYFCYLLLVFFVGWMIIAAWQRYKKHNEEILTKLNHLVEQRTIELKSKNELLSNLNVSLKESNDKLEQVSMTDMLTGLGNRRMLFKYLEKDIPATNRAYLGLDADTTNFHEIYKSDLLFFLIDVDHFKRINDQYGHPMGDRILIEICRDLKNMCRAEDYIIRYGGEEFLLVTRGAPRTEMGRIAEKIRETIERRAFKVSSEVSQKLSVSIGAVPYPFSMLLPLQLLPEQVIQLADICLYCAKNSGRNAWVSASSSSSSNQLSFGDLTKNMESLISQGMVEVMSSKELSHLKWNLDQGPFAVNIKD